MNVDAKNVIVMNMVNNMDLVKWKRVYDNNKRLDGIFFQKYEKEDIYRKNCIEFLVELGEFVNETKVFKYWSIKKPDKEKMLLEYADTITMCLTFYRELGLEIDDRYLHIDETDILKVINYLYQKISLLLNNLSEELIKDIFYNLLYLGELLEISEEETLNAICEKHKIIEERLNSDY